MKTSLSVKFVRFYGHFGYIFQDGNPTIQIPQSFEEIVFYRYNKETNKPKEIVRFILSGGEQNDLEFYMDIPELKKCITHRTPDAIKEKEAFSYCTQDTALWINESSINLVGPIYRKEDKTETYHNGNISYGSINYELLEFYSWTGGIQKTCTWSDYLQFLNLKCKLQKDIQHLRFKGGDVIERTNDLIKLLEDFKRDTKALVTLWKESDVDTLVLYCHEYDSKKKGGEYK